MFRLTIEGHFSAAHRICGYAGACRHLHGHNYRVVARIGGTELDTLGMLIDYGEVKGALAEVLAPFDHAYLNDLEPFAAINPTSEAIAHVLYQHLHAALFTTEDRRQRLRLLDVTVYETERQCVSYCEDPDADI